MPNATHLNRLEELRVSSTEGAANGEDPTGQIIQMQLLGELGLQEAASLLGLSVGQYRLALEKVLGDDLKVLPILQNERRALQLLYMQRVRLEVDQVGPLDAARIVGELQRQYRLDAEQSTSKIHWLLDANEQAGDAHLLPEEELELREGENDA